MICSSEEVLALLSERMGLPVVREVARWAAADAQNMLFLLDTARSNIGIAGGNALWCLTHTGDSGRSWLRSRQDELIDMLLSETHIGRRRMLLQLLREQSYDPEGIRTDFLDYCLAKINSEYEPYAIRCFSMYCAFKMCRHYPELITELNQYLDMLDTQVLSPGLKSALRTTRMNIRRLSRFAQQQ